MKLQHLESCCSTVYLYGVEAHSSSLKSKANFNNWLRETTQRLLVSDKQAIIYICDSRSKYAALKRVGFKRKCSYNGARSGIFGKATMMILDLRKFRKEVNRTPLKQKVKNWVATW